MWSWRATTTIRRPPQQALRGGWFHTGDAAVVHPDGYVEIRDRLKDVIISGGENISSVEVEGVLLRHPAVQEVAIVGCRMNAGARRRTLLLFSSRGERRPRKSCASLRARTSRISKRRTASRSVEELPKTATGKIQKYVLRGRPPRSRRNKDSDRF